MYGQPQWLRSPNFWMRIGLAHPPPKFKLHFDFERYTVIQYNDNTEQYQPSNLYFPESFKKEK